MASSLVVVAGEKVSTFGRRQGNISTNGLKGREEVSFGTCVCLVWEVGPEEAEPR